MDAIVRDLSSSTRAYFSQQASRGNHAVHRLAVQMLGDSASARGESLPPSMAGGAVSGGVSLSQDCNTQTHKPPPQTVTRVPAPLYTPSVHLVRMPLQNL